MSSKTDRLIIEALVSQAIEYLDRIEEILSQQVENLDEISNLLKTGDREQLEAFAETINESVLPAASEQIIIFIKAKEEHIKNLKEL